MRGQGQGNLSTRATTSPEIIHRQRAKSTASIPASRRGREVNKKPNPFVGRLAVRPAFVTTLAAVVTAGPRLLLPSLP